MNKKHFDESEFQSMSSNNYTRPAQIPIRADRLIYLTEKYQSQEVISDWIMYHHTDHFLIYSIKLNCCVFDASYSLLKEPHSITDDDIAAVITSTKINRDAAVQSLIGDGVGLIADLLTNLL